MLVLEDSERMNNKNNEGGQASSAQAHDDHVPHRVDRFPDYSIAFKHMLKGSGLGLSEGFKDLAPARI